MLRLRGKPLFSQFKTGHWVTYDEQRPTVRIGAESERSLFRKILFTKAKAWEYENEWRLVHYRGGAGVRTLEPGVLDGIILGSRICPHAEATVLRSVAASKEIDVMRAVESRDEYGLALEPPPAG